MTTQRCVTRKRRRVHRAINGYGGFRTLGARQLVTPPSPMPLSGCYAAISAMKGQMKSRMTTRKPDVIASGPNIAIVSATPGALPVEPLHQRRTGGCGGLSLPTVRALSKGSESNGRQSDEGRMNYDGLPQHVLVKLLALDEAVAALKAGADAVERGIEDRRARLWGNARRADDKPRALEAELERLLADHKAMQQRLQTEQSVLSGCKNWLDHLPADTKLEPVAVTADGHDLAGVRGRIKAANVELEALRRAPAPSEDIEARVRDYVRGLAPKVRGVGLGDWPGAQSASWYISEHT